MKRWIKISFISIISTFLLLGCASKNETSTPSPQVEKVQYSNLTPQKNESPEAVAQRLVSIATQITGVKNATALSIGPYSLVGLDVEAGYERGKVGTLKYTVAQAIKEDPKGSNVLVTADIDLTNRIKAINEDFQDGKPISGIIEEMAEIVSRISPQPSKEVPKQQKKELPEKS
ncbi:YhcN/YlaJ family sporulation lipoprotein [Hazenella sp. IB182357]|uniref:YhcN/YlaJ family sporulation lipoprotein n=1 Tax=Polycladospora coralii TaxID=2771432 RepID=A0A926N9B8_9BACL|nr:YhcN/YlaJ family sporulation lipoprotein [Polycladospora coralii]MBD1371290.1 YhcN/YlaJ family sporulation lipoprotein [Polycladospora coralii]